MRWVVGPERSLRWFRVALLATISVAAAGCSGDTNRFDSNPFRSRSQQPSNEVTGSVPQRSSSVQSAPLPPPSAATMHAPSTRPVVTGTAGGSRGMASYEPGPGRSTSGGDVTGSVPTQPAQRAWNWEGGTAITVQRGDTIDGLVKRYGVPASAIAEANNIPNGTALRPGQRLVIPKFETTGSTSAPRVAANTPAFAAPATGGNHVHIIAPGETLMKLSRQYHKPLAEIAKANNIPPHTLVKVGDRIIIPGVRGAQSAAVKPSAPMAKPQKPATVVAQQKPAAPPAQPRTQVASVPAATTANVVTPAAHNPEPEKVKRDVTAAMPTFRWPVRGRVVTAFGPKPSGAQNDGINVAVPEGTPVKAAEDGVVAYAGNELKTYGNLVLVRHANGYVTAYAHASEILVKRDDPVKRGQVIAKAGQTGTVGAPQLHFEIRKGSTPVDPIPFLDKGGNT
jgi:murein DD-endopeptidase MepM/ murein hydrolase activator NlpD